MCIFDKHTKSTTFFRIIPYYLSQSPMQKELEYYENKSRRWRDPILGLTTPLTDVEHRRWNKVSILLGKEEIPESQHDVAVQLSQYTLQIMEEPANRILLGARQKICVGFLYPLQAADGRFFADHPDIVKSFQFIASIVPAGKDTALDSDWPKVVVPHKLKGHFVRTHTHDHSFVSRVEAHLEVPIEFGHMTTSLDELQVIKLAYKVGRDAAVPIASTRAFEVISNDHRAMLGSARLM